MKIKSGFSLFALLLLAFPLFSQHYNVNGKVLDIETGRPLPFVNIVANDHISGTSTDIDGKFSLASHSEIDFLKLSYVGYEPLVFDVKSNKRNVVIRMKKTSLELSEVVIVAGENPAHRIIKKVIENRKKNDPENLQSFSYTSYEKMVVTVDTLKTNDTASIVDISNELPPMPDSSDIQLKNFIKQSDLFMLETVSERKFLAPDRNYEKVLASRVSGLKDPVFVFLSSMLQSPSFYKELIKIADKSYINPISDGSLKKYFFQLEDTTYTARGDSVFVISFRPMKNTNFDGMKGVLSINSFGWAIQNVMAEPARDESGPTIKIEQMYELINGENWFPVQMNTGLTFKGLMVNNATPVGRGKSYIRNIELNPDLVRRQFNQISIDIDPKAGDRDEDYWMKYRQDSLTRREQRTYEMIDSLGREANLDRIAATMKTVMDGRIPLGLADLDISKIIHYNTYEGLYLGVGLLTSKKLSQKFSLGGFWGYGFGDKASKYGIDLGITIDRYRDIRLRLAMFDYVTETSGTQFFDDRQNILQPENFRDYLINRMDRTERRQVSFGFRALRYGNFNVGLISDYKRVTNSYHYVPVAGNAEMPVPDSAFRFTELNFGFRYAYKEKLIQSPDIKISLGTKYPVVWFNYSRGIKGFLDGEYSYNKIDIKVSKTFFIRYFGKSSFDVRAGWVDKPIPYTNLYNGRGSYRVFTLFAPGSFATQRMNEFLSDRYIFLFYNHNFGKLLWRTPKFSPEFVVATLAGFGWLNHPEVHQNITFKTMEKGYFESGMLINNLLNMSNLYNLGVGAFYRYGANHLPKISDNFAWKFTIVFPFGEMNERRMK